MSTKRVNRFKADSEARHAEQTELFNSLTGAPKPAKRVPMNITLPQEQKNKLQAAAKAKGLTASVMIQMWIDEHCV